MRIENLTALSEMVGHNFPPTEWQEVRQDMINDFASATGDHQWIHIDQERASKESPFGKTIAHGFMSVSFLPKLIEGLMEIDSVKMGLNYGMDRLRFPQAVPVGSQLRAHVTLAQCEPYAQNGVKVSLDVKMEVKGFDKPACVGTFITLLFE